jgi:hypothetical protein
MDEVTLYADDVPESHEDDLERDHAAFHYDGELT